MKLKVGYILLLASTTFFAVSKTEDGVLDGMPESALEKCPTINKKLPHKTKPKCALPGLLEFDKDEKDEWLYAHNKIRKNYSLPDLVWDDSYAQMAQFWAMNNIFQLDFCRRSATNQFSQIVCRNKMDVDAQIFYRKGNKYVINATYDRLPYESYVENWNYMSYTPDLTFRPFKKYVLDNKKFNVTGDLRVIRSNITTAVGCGRLGCFENQKRRHVVVMTVCNYKSLDSGWKQFDRQKKLYDPDLETVIVQPLPVRIHETSEYHEAPEYNR